MRALEVNNDSKRDWDLSLDEVRAIDKFKNLTDEQAQKIIETLKTYSRIVYEFHTENKAGENLKPKIIPLIFIPKKQAA